MQEESNGDSVRIEGELRLIQEINASETKNPNRQISKKLIEKEARGIGARVRAAWKWGLENYSGEITRDLITGIGHIVDPFYNPCLDFRRENVYVDPYHKAIDHQKLPAHVDRLLMELNSRRIIDPTSGNMKGEPMTEAERASYAHFIM